MKELCDKVVQWHHDRGLIEGSSDSSQLKKLLEELSEAYAADFHGCMPSTIVHYMIADLFDLFERGRIKLVDREDIEEALKDSIGDQMVVLTNIAERNGWTLEECLAHSYEQIKDRKGRMVNGVFVKEGDDG